jgi:glycosyltransferase involved in cell wall biosynthesis
MKILVLSHTSDLIGGAERSMLDVFDNWTKNYDIEPIFILREPLGSMVGEMKKRGWKYHSVKFTFWSHPSPPKKGEVFRDSTLNAKAVKKIEKLIKRINPDIVITNTIVSPWAALAAYKQNVPHIWFVREYGDLDHGRYFEMNHDQVYKDIGNLSNLVVSNSVTLAKHIELYVDKAKVTTLYNPFNIKKMKEMAAKKVPNPYKYLDSLKLVMTSNISRGKGQLEAIEAVGILNQKGGLAEICILGKNVDKPYFAEIEGIIKKYGIEDKVHFLGLQLNALAYVTLADVGVVASRKEAFGRTTFDYLVVGRPVIGADSGATPEMVKNGKNGYLFKPGDSKELAKAVLNYAKNRSMLVAHGKYSSKLASEMMAGEHNIEALYKKVEAVAQGKGQPKGGQVVYREQWLDYQKNVKNHKDRTYQHSLKKAAYLKARGFARNQYYRGRKVKAQLTGK